MALRDKYTRNKLLIVCGLFVFLSVLSGVYNRAQLEHTPTLQKSELLTEHQHELEGVAKVNGSRLRLDNKLIDVSPYLPFLTPTTISCNNIFYKNREKKMKEMEVLRSEIKKHNKKLKEIRTGFNLTIGDKCNVGYTQLYPEETYVMWKLFSADFVKTICETGFNAGHSALEWLLIRPDIKVYSFDINQHPCTEPMAKHLMAQYPGRLQVIFGDSTETLPKFMKENPDVKCDVAVIDGGHDYRVSKADLDNFFQMTGPLNWLFYDNYPQFTPPGSKLALTWESAKRTGQIVELFRCTYVHGRQGFTFGYYVH